MESTDCHRCCASTSAYHPGGDPESPTLKQLRRTVAEHSLVELAGKKKARAVKPHAP